MKLFYTLLASIFLLVTTATEILSGANIKAIAFDFGGVIAKPYRSTLLNFLQDSFVLSNEELEAFSKQWLDVIAQNKNEEQFLVQYAQERNITLTEDWFKEYRHHRSDVKEIPGTLDIVKELKSQGYITALLSNSDAYRARLIAEGGYYNFFEPLLLSHVIGVHKPQPEAYQLLLAALKLPAEEVIFVDDQSVNCSAASRLGIIAIQFKNAEQLAEELKVHGVVLGEE